MSTNSALGSDRVGGRINLILVLLTFVALCAAFFAGAIHQTDSVADPHDSAVAASVPQTADELAAVSPAAAAVDSVVTSTGWLTALVTACALFVLCILTVVFGRLLASPSPSRSPATPTSWQTLRPALATRVGRPILLETSISRT